MATQPTVMQWVNLLEAQIIAQTQYAAPYERRYRNEHVLPFLEAEYRQVYGARVDQAINQLRAPRVGMAAIGVDALVERLTVLGGAAEDSDVAKRLDAAWTECDLDVMHREAHREALIKARSFVQVARSDDGRAVVGVEAPEQMAVHRMAGPPYDVDAALKIMVDEWTGQRTARLWLPGRNIDLIEGQQSIPDPEGSNATSRWAVVDEQPSGLPRVPVVELTHKARLLANPQSELEPISTLIDVCDLIEGLMVFAGHFGAVPIRYVTGLEVPKDPKDPTKPLLGPDGKPQIGFNPRADSMWVSTSKDTTFGQLTPASLNTFIEWADHASAMVRARTQVSSTYYSLDLKSHMSAELLKADEAPMVRRVRGMGENGPFGQAWRSVMQLILMTEDPAADLTGVTARWDDPETRIDSQAGDAMQKLVSSGLGVKVVAKKMLGWSDPEIDEAVSEHEATMLRQAEMTAQANDPVLAALSKPMPRASASVQ